MKKTYTIILSVLLCTSLTAQRSMEQDSSLNNLVHAEDYQTDPTPSLGSFKKMGKGKKDMILIPGLGFDENIFNDFMKANQKEYTMYSVTLAGFGSTSAPAMPKEDNKSYGKMAWTNIAINDIVDLIKTQKLNKPILVGHFLNGTQIAFEIGLRHSDLISSIVIIGGEPFRYFTEQNDPTKPLSPERRIAGIDRYFAPTWFKTVTEKTWDDNMYSPEHYSANEELGQSIWDESASVPVPVMVRYLCEFFSYDATVKVNNLKVPTLVLVPSFNEKLINDPMGTFLKPQFIDSWEYVKKVNPDIRFETIQGSRLFIWKDQLKATSQVISNFISKN